MQVMQEMGRPCILCNSTSVKENKSLFDGSLPAWGETRAVSHLHKCRNQVLENKAKYLGAEQAEEIEQFLNKEYKLPQESTTDVQKKDTVWGIENNKVTSYSEIGPKVGPDKSRTLDRILWLIVRSGSMNPVADNIPVQPSYKCNRCIQRFYQLTQLQRHMHIHIGQRQFRCALCRRCFGYASQLHAHMYSEQEDRVFTCLLCKQLFSQLISLRHHLIHEHGMELVHRARNSRARCNTRTDSGRDHRLLNSSTNSLSETPQACSDGPRKQTVEQKSDTGNKETAVTIKKMKIPRCTANSDTEHKETAEAFKNAKIPHCTVGSDSMIGATNGRGSDIEWEAEKITDVVKQKEELSYHAAALDKLKHAKNKVVQTRRHKSLQNGHSGKQGHDGNFSEEHYHGTGVSSAPECSPKDSGVDVSSPWPREFEGSDNGTEHAIHPDCCCAITVYGKCDHSEKNNNHSSEPSLGQPDEITAGESDGEEMLEQPPILEKEPPILDVVQPVFNDCMDEPSDLSEEETVGMCLQANPAESLLCTPDNKLKNDVYLPTAQGPNCVALHATPSHYQDSFVVDDNSTLNCSPAESLSDGYTSSQLNPEGLELGMEGLFPDLNDTSSRLRQSCSSTPRNTPSGKVTTKVVGFQNEFAKFLQGQHVLKSNPKPETYTEAHSKSCPRKRIFSEVEQCSGSKQSLNSSASDDILNKRQCTGLDIDTEEELGIFPLLPSDGDSTAGRALLFCPHKLCKTSPDDLARSHQAQGRNLSNSTHLQCQPTPSQDCGQPTVPVPRMNVKLFLCQQKRVTKLRRLVCRFFKTVFPSLEYPRKFSRDGPAVECLIDQVVEAATGHITKKPKALCLDSEVHNVSVMLCRKPTTCIRHLRKKVFHLLQTLLPDLEVDSDFNASSEEVDKLLGLVVRCNI